MKKSFPFLLLFFSFLIPMPPFSAAQIYNDDYSNLQKINMFKENNVWMVYGWTFLYSNGKQEKNGRKSSFERFNREGNRTEEVHYDNKGNPDLSCQYIYDERGNQIRKIGNAGTDIICEQWSYTYYQNGRKAERKSEFKRSKNEKWVYRFDARENVIAEIYYDITGTLSFEWKFIYDYRQCITSKTEQDAYGNIYQKWVYSYDNKGNNTEIHHYVSNNQLYRIYQMRYDKKGNIKSKFTFDKSENILNLTVYVYQFYDGLHAPNSAVENKI